MSDELRGLVERDEFFWLDLVRPSPEEVARLEPLIGLDHRALEHTLEFGRTPEIRRYKNHVELVFFGAEGGESGKAELIEVHIYVSGGSCDASATTSSARSARSRSSRASSPPSATTCATSPGR